mgnify:CR=1 FL=1
MLAGPRFKCRSLQLGAEFLSAVRQQPALHTLLETKRDTFIAHADWDARSTAFLRIDGDAVLRQSPMPNVRKGLDLDEFRKLATAVAQECRRKAFDLDFAQGANDRVRRG